MEFAVNYSPILAELVRAGQVHIDRFKCPAWPKLVEEARQVAPVYIHFPLGVGGGSGSPVDFETKAPADLERIADLQALSGTPYINTHFGPPAQNYPGIEIGSRAPRDIERVVSATLRDLETLILRFGAENVLVENVINEYGFLTLGVLPETIAKVLEKSGCGFLFDHAHARLAARSLGLDARAYSAAMPVERIREIHETGLQIITNELIERVKATGSSGGLFGMTAGQWMDHFPMRPEDWPELEWLAREMALAPWSTPWVFAYEYGGVSGFWDLISDRQVYLEQVPRMAAMIKNSSLTEAVNPRTADLDRLPTFEMLQRINAEDARVPRAVAQALPQIAAAVDQTAARMRQGGRLIYIGAGTSGRLGVLDASEIPPTYGMDPERVVGVIAGGERAIRHSVEGAEDNPQAGGQVIAELGVSALDSVVGIAASGRTPFVLGALEEARRRGALTISVACNTPAAIEGPAEIRIALLVGPEVISGSTRMKAGTAQKLVLNMLSTGVMVRLGKTYGNLMVDLRASNQKLRVRAGRIVAHATGLDEAAAVAALEAANGEVKTAIVAVLAGVSPEAARQRLERSGGFVRQAVDEGLKEE